MTRTRNHHDIAITPIQQRYKGEAFNCAHQEFNDYLQATLYQSRRTERIYVAVDERRDIVGYYALSACSIEFDDADYQQGIEKPLIAARIMSLAVDRRMTDRGIARRLLGHAMLSIYEVLRESQLDIQVILCDTPNSRAKSFYLHYGFISLPGTQRAVFLPVSSLRHIID